MFREPYQACIEACKTCAKACDMCVAESRHDPNSQLLSRCKVLCMDCAAMCRLAAGYMARESEFIDLVCQDCAEVCAGCAEECLKHPMDYCQDCAAACHACEDACLKMGTAPFRPVSVYDSAYSMGAST